MDNGTRAILRHAPLAHSGRLILSLALLVGGVASGVSRAETINLEIRELVPLPLLLKAIAARGGFELSIQPNAATGMMSTTLRDVEPIDALEFVCKLNGLRLAVAPGRRSAKAYSVCVPAIREGSGCLTWTRRYRLKAVSAGVALHELRARFADELFDAEPDDNVVVLRGHEEFIKQAVARLAEIDC